MKNRTFTDTALTIAMAALLIAFMATLIWVRGASPWFRTLNILLFFGGAYAISFARQARADRRLDEVELAAARFGARWGLVSGVALVTILAVLPPVHTLLAELAGVFGRIQDRSMTVESRLFLFGIITTFVAQEFFRSVFTAAWKWSKR